MPDNQESQPGFPARTVAGYDTQRLDNVRERVATLEGAAKSYATKDAVEKAKSELIKWIVATGLTAVGVAVALAIFVQGLIN